MDNTEFNAKLFIKRVAQNISRIRKSKGYSQDRLSMEAGFARGSLTRIESGEFDIKISTVGKIADALGVPVTRFFEFRK